MISFSNSAKMLRYTMVKVQQKKSASFSAHHKCNKIKNYKRQICFWSVLSQICRCCVTLYIEILWVATNLNKVDIVIRQM